MESPLPPAENVEGLEASGPEEEPQPHCFSSDFGSEANDPFPTALALDAADDPNDGTSGLNRSTTSQRVMGMIRRGTGNLKRQSTAVGRENTELGSTGTAEAAAAARVMEPTNISDGQRVAVQPASPRPSKTFSLRRKLSDMLGLGARTTTMGGTAVLDWKPHENILKLLGYRPRCHGRPFTDSYSLGGELGRGGFGVVREGTYKADGEVYAVKVIPREAVPDIGALVQEVDILRRLDHFQVMRFIDFHEEPQTYYLVLEKVPGGELFDRIISEGRFCEDDARACVRSLLEALAYCHSRQVAHRDIKPENLLFASLDVKDRTIKLADFGLARSVADGPLGGATCGTPSYMAPESLKILPHGTQVDCWGAGIVTHILLGGYAPFASSRMEKLFRLIKKGRVSFDDACWGSVTKRAKDFILALLKVDPDTRLTAEQALRHPWLTEPCERADGLGNDVVLSLSKLKVFSAKRKFRMAIHAWMACKKFHGLALVMAGADSIPVPAGEENGEEGTQHRGDADSGSRRTSGLPTGNATTVGGAGSAENRRRTFKPGTSAKQPSEIRTASPRPTGYEKRRFFAKGRKATGIFSEQDWRTSIKKPSTMTALGSSAALLGSTGVAKELSKIVAKRAEEEEEDVQEEEEDFSSGDDENLLPAVRET